MRFCYFLLETGNGFLFQVIIIFKIVQSYLLLFFLSVQCSISEILEEFLVAHGVSIDGVLEFNAIGVSLSMLSNNRLLKLDGHP